MRTINLTALSGLVLLAACGKEKDSAGDTDTKITGCTITAAAEYPIDGQVDAYYRSPVEFDLSEADSSASISLTDGAGADVAGTVSFSDDGETVYFTPSSPLTSSTSYTATLSWCSGEESASIGFTTSALGAPLTADLVGRTYNVDITSGRFLEPPGVGDLLGGLLENSILFGVTSADASSITFRGAISETGNTNQDVCTPSLEDLPSADFSGQPYFELSSNELALSVAGITVNIDAITVSGTFAADGTYCGGGVLSGELDARDIGPLLEGQLDDTSPDAICDLLIGFGVACQSCSSDGQPYCATILVDQIVAEEQSGELQSVAQENCFEGCADSCTNAECAEASTFAVCN